MTYEPKDAVIRIETRLGSAGTIEDAMRAAMDVIERERLDPQRISRCEFSTEHELNDGRPVGWVLVIEGRRTS